MRKQEGWGVEAVADSDGGNADEEETYDVSYRIYYTYDGDGEHARRVSFEVHNCVIRDQ